MIAKITEGYDLERSWDKAGARRITFIPISNCEFNVKVDLHLTEGLNYQGSTRITFSTTCYAQSLWDFWDSLHALQQGRETSAVYHGSGDMELKVAIEVEQPEIGERRALICTLDYQPFQILEEIAIPARLHVPLGGVGVLNDTLTIMGEFLRR